MSFQLFKINELYTNYSGTVGYIELLGTADGQNQLAGHTIQFIYTLDAADFTFPSDLPSATTLNKTVLLATQGFADLGLVTPDYIIPDQIVGAGMYVIFPGAPDQYNSVVIFIPTFTDATQAYYSNGNGGTPSFPIGTIAGDNTPSNFAGDSGFIPGNPMPGTVGADNLLGTAAGDFMVGRGGNDTLNGGAGNDTLIGGAGNDIFVVAQAGDVVTELTGGGTDTLKSSAASFVLPANVEKLALLGTAGNTGEGNTMHNVLTGNTGDNTLIGAQGNDTMDGGLGNDSLYGGLGNDTYVIDAVGDVMSELGSGGTDTVQSAIPFTLPAGFENLVLTGTGNLNGGGNAGANVLTGNAGANILDGMGGADALYGMNGNDTFIWSAIDPIFDGGAGTDALRLTGGNLYLPAIANSQIQNVEIINMTGAGNNLLTLNAADVLDISSTTNTLKVLGNVGDSVNIVPGFSDLGVVSGFHKYTFGGAVLLVDTDITNVA